MADANTLLKAYGQSRLAVSEANLIIV